MGKALRTKASLIQAAVDQISGDGDLHPGRVASKVGVSEASFYAHFGTKDGALAAAFTSAITAVDQAILDELEVAVLARRGLEASVGAAVDAAIAAFGRHGAVVRLAAGRIASSTEVRDAYRKAERAALVRIEQILRQAAAAGLVRNAPGTATTMLVLFQGLANPLVLGDPDARDRHSDVVVALLS